jgi:RHS repeat-associated protein
MDQRTPTGVWEARWYAYDGHGSVRLLTDGTARATDRYDYDAFGNVLAQWVSNPQTGALDLLAPGNAHLATPNTHLYCGEAYLPALGLYHLRARLMNPLTGRFWTMDSYEGENSDPASLHKYLYANADPVNGIDPTGRKTISERLVAAGVSATLAARITASVTRAVKVFRQACDIGLKIVDAVDTATDAAEGVYILVDAVDNFYVGKSINLELRSKVSAKERFPSGKPSKILVEVDLKSIPDVKDSERHIVLRTVEQFILNETTDEVGPQGKSGGPNLNRNNPRRGLDKFEKLKRSLEKLCPGGKFKR